MSGHFVYEIDERKLRVKLQEIEVEQKQDSWSNFESYYLSKNKAQNDGPLKNFYVPISMNIVLPLVFGLIIIIVAVILFKFISIKNPEIKKPVENKPLLQPTTKQDSSAYKISVLREKVVKDSIEKIKIRQLVIIDSLTAKRLDSIKALVNKMDIKKIDNGLSTENKINKESNTKAIQTSAITTNTAGVKDSIKTKKKKRKSSADSIQQEKLLEELIPIPDENEASLKPN